MPRDERHIVIPLLGDFKYKQGEWWHLLLIAATPSSGFKPQIWLDIVVALLKAEGKGEGPVICDEDGTLISANKLEDTFHEHLIKILMTKRLIQNHWKTFENSQGSSARSKMRDHYLKIKLVSKKLLVCSSAL
eukprot:11572186-Ditylum_brightwellii.AAC.1